MPKIACCAPGSRRLLDTPTAHAIAALAVSAHDALTNDTKTSKTEVDAKRKARVAKLGGSTGVAAGIKLSWLLYSGGKLVICNGMPQLPRQYNYRRAAEHPGTRVMADQALICAAMGGCVRRRCSCVLRASAKRC